MNKEIEIPEGYKARIEGNKVILEPKESNDERIVDGLIEFLRCSFYVQDSDLDYEKIEKWIALLEKQKAKEKYDRMAPIYSDQQSFEAALEKAWKFYNDSGSRTVDGLEDNSIELSFAKGFREGFLCKEKQKEQKLEVKYVYPKFRIGDEIVEICPNGSCSPVVVKYIGDGGYSCESKDKKRYLSFPIKLEDNYKFVEQKPTEWNEEDEKHKQAIIDAVQIVMEECEDAESIEKYKDDIDWFKSIHL